MTPDRRRAPRAATIFTIGKLIVDGAELHCMVRDLSPNGMRIQMHEPPVAGARVVVEMRGLPPTKARVRWVSGRDAGLLFDADCDVAQVFETRLNRLGQLARSPRFAIMREAPLTTEAGTFKSVVWDISVGGAKLLLDTPLPIGTRGAIAIGRDLSGGVLTGRICWARQDAFGFQFDRPLSSVALSSALLAVRL